MREVSKARTLVLAGMRNEAMSLSSSEDSCTLCESHKAPIIYQGIDMLLESSIILVATDFNS